MIDKLGNSIDGPERASKDVRVFKHENCAEPLYWKRDNQYVSDTLICTLTLCLSLRRQILTRTLIVMFLECTYHYTRDHYE